MTCVARPWRRWSGWTSTVWMPTQSPSSAARPRARSPISTSARTGRVPEDDSGVVVRRTTPSSGTAGACRSARATEPIMKSASPSGRGVHRRRPGRPPPSTRPPPARARGGPGRRRTRRTTGSASVSDTSGSPIASTELARRRCRPSYGGAARSSQPPNGWVSTSGHSDSTCSSASYDETRWRTDGRGGTCLPDTMSASGISTGGPSSGSTTQARSLHEVHTPRTSVIAGPPDGPVSPRSRRRTTTRVPTTWGPSRWAWGEACTGGY